MGNIHIVIQPELVFSLIIMTILSIFFVLVGRKVKVSDPTKRPKGCLLYTSWDLIINKYENLFLNKVK